jgi:hypothetical protein
MLGLIAAAAAGCGADRSGPPATPAPSPTTRVASVSTASVRLSVTTHHRAEILSDLRISGSCDHGKVIVAIGRRAPYEPLRKVGNASIDRTRPPRRARLTTMCEAGRFQIARRGASVRIGAGPLTATARERGNPVVVRIDTVGME